MLIGLIGGTGPQGTGIALRLAKAGLNVTIGSRSEERAKSIAKKLNEKINSNFIEGMENKNVIINAPILFLTVPFENAIETLMKSLDEIKNNCKIMVDITVPMKYEKNKGMVPIKLEEGSASKKIADLITPVPVVGALKTISAHALNDIDIPLHRDTFIVGPQEERKQIIDLLKNIETLRPVDAGPLREAECVERMVPFLININRRYKIKDAGVKLTF